MNIFKKLLMLILFINLFVSIFATTITIGTGTTISRRPLACYYGYERSANLFLASEIGMTGYITDLAWYATLNQSISIPTKIYLKTITDTTLTSVSWATLISDATLVFDSNVRDFTANTWKVVDINDWTLTVGNLLVLTECNYGEEGTGSSNGAGFTNTTMSSNLTSFLYQDDYLPSGNMSLSHVRPNIRMNISTQICPAVFSMYPTAIDYGQGFLNLTSSPTNVFVTNSGGTAMTIVSAVLGGETPSGFIVNDSNTYPVTLNPGSRMSFTIQFSPTIAQQYSASITFIDDQSRTSHILPLNGMGLDVSINTFPYTENFDGTIFPPLGWTNYRVQGLSEPGTWERQIHGTYPTCLPHSGTGMALYRCYSLSNDNQGALVSPPLNLPGNNYRVKFWMYRDDNLPETMYDNEMVSVWLNSAPDMIGADSLGVIHRRLDLSPVESVNGWYAYTLSFPPTATGTKYVIFKGHSCTGYNIYIDDVTFEVQPIGSPFPATLIAPLNGSVNQEITTTLNWWADGSGPSPTSFRLSIGTDNPPTNLLNNYNVSYTMSYSPTLQYETTYYWQVIPCNAVDQAANCPVWSFTTIADPTVTNFPYFQNFDGVEAPELPEGWSKILVSPSPNAQLETIINGNPHSYPNHVYFRTSGDSTASLILVSPPTPNLVSTRIRFWAYGSDGINLIVGTMSNPANPSSFTPFQTITLHQCYREYNLSFNGYNGSDRYIGFKPGNPGIFEEVLLDDFTWQLIPTGSEIEVDQEWINYSLVHANATATKPLIIRNTGLSNLSFSVSTTYPTITTDCVGTQTLSPDSSQICDITIHPTLEGDFYGSIHINSNDSQNPNLEIPIGATILPALPPGIVEVGVGTLENLSIPTDEYSNHSFSQTIYLQQELNQPNSQINSVFYQYDGVSSWADSIRIFMGHTTQAQFLSSTDWIPESELTLVYSGLLQVSCYQLGWVELPLQDPFIYDNVSNLVICVDKDMGHHHFYYDTFFCTDTVSNRSLEQHSDYDNSSVIAPFAGNLRMAVPNTRLLFQVLTNEPIISLAPSTVNFGQVNVNSASEPIDIRIKNIGGGALTITQPVTLAGVDEAQFTLTDTNTYPQILGRGQSCLVSVTFQPTTEGSKNAELNVTDDLRTSRNSIQSFSRQQNMNRLLHSIPIFGLAGIDIITEFPYTQGFEDVTFPDNPWRVDNEANPEQGWRRESIVGSSHNGEAYAITGTMPGNHWLITPPFLVTTESNTLRFWLKNDTETPDDAESSVTEYMDVLLSTCTSDTASFNTSLMQFTNFNILETYQEFLVDLNNNIGNVVRVAFMRHSTNGKLVFLDDFSISMPPPAAYNPPTNLSALLEINNVHLSWQIPVHQISDHLSGYKIYRNDVLLDTLMNPLAVSYTDSTVSYGFYTYNVKAIYGQTASVYSNSFSLDVTFGYPNLIFADSFDSYPDFSMSFGRWSNVDVDQSNTFNFDQISYQNMTIPKSFMVFNPNATSPQMSYLSPHSGYKMLACFDSSNPPNNDWLITPHVRLGTNSSISFWAKSYTAFYGLEKFNFLISQSDMNPASFISITGADTVSVPANQWVLYNYDLSLYNNRSVYIAIQCVSDFAAALLIDDVKIVSNGGFVGTDDPVVPVNKLALLGNYPNPFNPETTIKFTLREKRKVSIDIFNTRGQKVTTLLDEVRNAGNQSVIWNGKDEYGHPVASGVYFYQMKAGIFSQTKKMVLLK